MDFRLFQTFRLFLTDTLTPLIELIDDAVVSEVDVAIALQSVLAINI